MTKQRAITKSRFDEIMRRQLSPGWGAAYQPGIRATVSEAPSASRPAEFWAERLGRTVHALSSIETRAMILALWNPALFELHEQRMLSIVPTLHPLVAHPRADGLALAPLQGTIAVAERLNTLNLHPRMHYVDAKLGRVEIPSPLFGDLLLFLLDQNGPYCVNWSVKQAEADFGRSIDLKKRTRDPSKDAAKANARHAIEAQYYDDADIRTVRVVLNDLPDTLSHNLRVLFLHQRRPDVSGATEADMIDRLKAATRMGEPPQGILLSMAARHGQSIDTLQKLAYHCLWTRKVKVDLFRQSIFLDRPLQEETIDPFHHYARLFSRGGY
ncbi:hypothetical protein [Janthinobacterium lividum]|uniref:hypothetical protein n=1 Tax=Janthinobacterium lividum TaxID=29581 RepID=UPI0011137C66|nr:hypothetical protein [Janthinobacterium lividum]